MPIELIVWPLFAVIVGGFAVYRILCAVDPPEQGYYCVNPPNPHPERRPPPPGGSGGPSVVPQISAPLPSQERTRRIELE